MKEDKTLRGRLHDIPVLNTEGLRDCQTRAINNLEVSFKDQRPKALIQMATGSGKTFTAITFIYRLLKYAEGKRVLFLVDTKNLGEQAEGEFKSYIAKDDNRLFTELYGMTRLNSSFIPNDSQVYISTIQRMYSILKGTELDESAEEENPNETRYVKKNLCQSCAVKKCRWSFLISLSLTNVTAAFTTFGNRCSIISTRS